MVGIQVIMGGSKEGLVWERGRLLGYEESLGVQGDARTDSWVSSGWLLWF